jgi:hypothetical protein
MNKKEKTELLYPVPRFSASGEGMKKAQGGENVGCG